MKQNFKKIIIICSLIIICLFPIIPSFADSGYDGSYDSGSSSSDWGDSPSSSNRNDHSNSSSSRGSSSSSSHNDDSIFSLFIDFIIIIYIGYFILLLINVIIVKIYLFFEKIIDFLIHPEKRHMVSIAGNELSRYKKDEVLKLIPDFDEENFKQQAYELYKAIQIAWMNFDENAIRKYTTDALYNTYSSQLALLKVKQEKNIMKDFELQQVQIAGMEVKENFVSLAVSMTISCYDFIVDANGKAIRGNENKKVTYKYLMIFNKGLSQKPNKCPNCGASLEDVNSNTCPYCRSNLINENYDWVLSKKQVLSQTKNTHK